MESVQPCSQVLGLATPTSADVTPGFVIPSNHPCTNASLCKAYYGASSDCCTPGTVGACLACPTRGAREAQVCIFCNDNPCYLATPSISPATPTCPLLSCAPTSTAAPFLFGNVTTEQDRYGSDLRSVVNQNLTVGVTYLFNAPPVATWSAYLSRACDLTQPLRFRLNLTSLSSVNSITLIPGNEVLINAATGFIAVTPSAAYTVTVTVSVDAGADSADVAQWTFTSRQPDVVESSVARTAVAAHPTYGPANSDCARGTRVDGTRYDTRYTCDCTGTAHTGPRCETPSTAPQLRVPVWSQLPPAIDLQLGNFVLASDNRMQWAVDATYRVAAISPQPRAFSVSGGVTTDHSVTYDLLWNTATPPQGFFIDQTSGAILLVVPQVDGVLRTVSVRAVAPGTLPATLYNLSFQFTAADTADTANGPGGIDCVGGSDQRIDIIEFDRSYACVCPAGFGGAQCQVEPELRLPGWRQVVPSGSRRGDLVFARDNRTQWALSTTYRLAPIEFTRAFAVGTNATNVSVTFTMRWNTVTNPRGFFIDGQTGEVLLQTPSTAGIFTASVQADSPGITSLTLYTVVFEFLPADTTASTNGPGQSDCAGGLGQRVDGTEFDRSYTCVCSGGFSGDLCQLQPALRLSAWQQFVPNGNALADFVTLDKSEARLNRAVWAFGETYRVAPINVTTGYTDAAPSTPLAVSFGVRWHNTSSPRGFFIDQSSGEILLQIPSISALYTASVEAQTTSTAPLELYNATFDFRQSDTASVSNGPNGVDCAGGSNQHVDLIEFDRT